MDIHIHECIHMKNILPLGEPTEYGGPRKYGSWDAESVTVLGRTFPASDSWKSIASERPSNAIESLGGEPEYR